MKKIITSLLLALLISMPALAADQVNINVASAQEIAEALNGVGISKAEKIVEYREMNGPFAHIDELVNVKGIGLRTVDKNRDAILLNQEGEPE